ncbi:phosphatase PAP2 family protein [Streptomyces sp. NPDC058657]|uniref:phosphatase PAP2 family protein n=1 Tax=unclassified Streptomyces TaxID=2593676 RepID=UPI0036619F64
MRETPRPRVTADGTRASLSRLRPGRAFAHTPGASGPGSPHRSDGVPPHTPRGVRPSGPADCPGATPPAPGQSAFPLHLAAAALLFALITWQIVVRGPLLRADERLSGAVVDRGPSGVAEFLADLGNLQVALPLLAVSAGYALWRGRRLLALAAVLAMGLVPAVVVPLKALIGRPSPLDPAESGYFPSGHAATAAVAYCGAALLLAACGRGRWPVACAFVLCAANGTGLVLRGYHWPLDVVGSWCLAVLLLAPVWWLGGNVSARRLGGGAARRRSLSPGPPSGPPRRASRAPGEPGR